MGEHASILGDMIQVPQDSFPEMTWTALIAVLVFFCIATRIVTGIQSRPGRTDPEEPQTVRMVPYWFPWIGHGFSLSWDYLSFMEKTR